MNLAHNVMAAALAASFACTTSDTSDGGGSGNGAGSDAGANGSSSSSTTSSSSGGIRDAGVVLSTIITGRMLSPSGTSGIFEGRVWVEWEQDGTTARRQSSTRYDGRYTLNGVPPGAYTVHAERGAYAGQTAVTLAAVDSVVEDADIRVVAGAARFVVVSGYYDDIGAIVTDLGFATQPVSGNGFGSPPATWLGTVATDAYLADKTAVMLNCGLDDDFWSRTDLEDRRTALRTYVESGHSLYISDWAYGVMEWLYPEVLDFYGEDATPGDAKHGDAEQVLASIGDETLAKLVGRFVGITYDLPAWAVMLGLEQTDGGTAPYPVDVLATGTVHVGAQEFADVPLAVRVHIGEGAIVYTTFHNEAQLDPTVLSILRYMVLRL